MFSAVIYYHDDTAAAIGFIACVPAVCWGCIAALAPRAALSNSYALSTLGDVDNTTAARRVRLCDTTAKSQTPYMVYLWYTSVSAVGFRFTRKLQH